MKGEPEIHTRSIFTTAEATNIFWVIIKIDLSPKPTKQVKGTQSLAHFVLRPGGRGKWRWRA